MSWLIQLYVPPKNDYKNLDSKRSAKSTQTNRDPGEKQTHSPKNCVLIPCLETFAQEADQKAATEQQKRWRDDLANSSDREERAWSSGLPRHLRKHGIKMLELGSGEKQAQMFPIKAISAADQPDQELNS